MLKRIGLVLGVLVVIGGLGFAIYQAATQPAPSVKTDGQTVVGKAAVNDNLQGGWIANRDSAASVTADHVKISGRFAYIPLNLDGTPGRESNLEVIFAALRALEKERAVKVVSYTIDSQQYGLYNGPAKVDGVFVTLER